MPLFTPEATLSYPALFASKLGQDAKPTDKKKWSTTALFTAEAVKTPEFAEMVKTAIAVAVEKFGPTTGRELKWNEKGYSYVTLGDDDDAIRLPFRRDTKKKGYPEQFVVMINCSKVDNRDEPGKTCYPPQVVGRNGLPLKDHDEIYPGVRARLSLSCFGYNSSGNKGAAFGLNNAQKLGDGARIAGPKSASEEFGALDPEPAAAMPGEAGEPSLNTLLGL